jgi:hypothetical protein
MIWSESFETREKLILGLKRRYSYYAFQDFLCIFLGTAKEIKISISSAFPCTKAQL